MNRSIMIVICDFLVLCALSLSSGLSELPDTILPETPGYRDGYAVVPTNKTVAASDYEELKSQAEKMQEEIARLKAGAASERMRFSKAEFARQQQQLKTQQQLTEAEKKVGDMASRLFRTENELKDAAQALINARKENVSQKKDLQVSAQRVEDLKKALNATRSMAGSQEKEILWHRKQLERSQAKQDAIEKQLNATRNFARDKEIALTKADSKISALNSDLSRTSYELRKSKEYASAADKRLAELQGQLIRKTEETAGLQKLLNYTKKQLETAENKLISTSLEKYSSSTVKLSFTVSNIRPLLGNNVFNRVQYLPEIRLENKVWLPAALLPVTGLDRNFSGYTQVNDLRYTVSLPSGTRKEEKLVTSFVIPKNAGLCLIPVKGMSGSPLPVLTWDKLKKRGLRNLTLFKANQFGTASAELAERCSIDITGKDRALFIRNSHRHGSELLAEPGDIIITKEGEYVGTVTGLANNSSGHSTARCFVFPSERVVQGDTLPIVRKQGEQFYTGFSTQAEALRTNLKKIDPVYNK